MITRVRIALLVALAALSLTSASALAGGDDQRANATRPQVLLASCGSSSYGGAVKPRTWSYGCTTSYQLVGAVWHGWKLASAIGVGKTQLNDCTPDCSSGHVYLYPARAKVSRIRQCSGKDGVTKRYYTRLLLTFTIPKGSGAGPPGRHTQAYDIACQ